MGLIPERAPLGDQIAPCGNALPAPRSVFTISTKRTAMKSGIRDKMEGSAKEAKGAAKQAWAKAAGDPQKHVEGSKDRASGKFQQKTGEIKRDIMRE